MALNNQVQVSTNKINILLNKELEYQQTIKELKASNELIEPLARFIKNVMVDKPITAPSVSLPYYNGPPDLPPVKPAELDEVVVDITPSNIKVNPTVPHCLPKLSPSTYREGFKSKTPPNIKVITPPVIVHPKQSENRVNVEGELLGEYDPKKDQGSYTLGKVMLTGDDIEIST